MDTQKVDMFIMSKGEFFPTENIPYIREKMLALDDSKFVMISVQEFKDPKTALIISLFFGAWGIDRFYLGQSGLGVAKLLTCGGAGIWALIDLFKISQATREINYQKLIAYLG